MEGAIAPNVPLLTDTLEVSVESVNHDSVHAEHVLPWLEAAGGEVPLEIERVSIDCSECSEGAGIAGNRPSMAYFILDLGIAPHWGHILRHDDGNGLF